MKVSELILELQDFMAAYGDREVLFAEYGSYDGAILMATTLMTSHLRRTLESR